MNKFDHNSGKHLSIDDAEIYYEVIGSERKPVLLFLHGGFGSIEDFNSIVDYLSKDYRIIGIDNRGHGKSTLGRLDLTYEHIQKDVERVIEHLNVDKLNVIGFSDGGIVGYRLASMTSTPIEKLVTIGADWHVKYLEAVRDIFSGITSESWRKKFPETYELYQKVNPEPDFERFTKSIINMWTDTSSSGLPSERVRNISCPTLIVRGDDDHLVSKQSMFELSEVIKGARLLNIPFAGHVAFEEQKEIFITSVIEFLKK